MAIEVGVGGFQKFKVHGSRRRCKRNDYVILMNCIFVGKFKRGASKYHVIDHDFTDQCMPQADISMTS